MRSYTFTWQSSDADSRRDPEPSRHSDVIVCKQRGSASDVIDDGTDAATYTGNTAGTHLLVVRELVHEFATSQ
jgi:hypothetical protein